MAPNVSRCLSQRTGPRNKRARRSAVRPEVLRGWGARLTRLRRAGAGPATTRRSSIDGLRVRIAALALVGKALLVANALASKPSFCGESARAARVSDYSPPSSIRRAGAGAERLSAPNTGSLVEFAALARVGNSSFLANVLATKVFFSSERVVCAAAEREVLLGR
jgi:hypothetical protein